MRRLLLACFLIATAVAHSQAFYGRTSGPLVYLNYGLGEDRLGGAKAGFLDSNVLVKVVDSVKADYKVQLSKAHFAYLPKSAFRTDTAIKLQAYYLTGSWKVYGDSAADYVNISLTEKLPYKSVQQINPARLVVDVFGVTSNTNWITQLKTTQEIKNAWYEQVEDDVFRIFIELKHQQHWGYSIAYKNNVLQIKIKRQPPSLSLKKLKIAIDAGHGGTNAGADGLTSKVLEKDYTLKIAKEVEAYLKKKGAAVYMTRTHDTDLSMVERTVMLREQAPDFLISIHLNSAGSPTVKGTSTYYRYIGFRPLSQAILKRMLELGLDEYGNVGSFNFSLSGPTEYPNCLVEVAFLSNPDDEKKILDPKFHKAVAKKITQGIEDWLKGMK
ncbi:N-acetylmuramoyl-L-alanine amidase [Flavisolibacter ginsenosidimutans]|uniref:N-acetylmuramoyl-L-alanine amidase n=1 Tax=Flavisolibacter ginsenosidimutans TaxID=661481 RepID=A0A5B8UMZ1_9BACT|nr:N-acetylmuramoyl-L-alanine amidase [Flavisolibacter ginsenosidimutans]QEC57579.1 N-acetylmuramoyl-L-alanine amidase [Flavisolibacter ginsenosidimutans]